MRVPCCLLCRPSGWLNLKVKFNRTWFDRWSDHPVYAHVAVALAVILLDLAHVAVARGGLVLDAAERIRRRGVQWVRRYLTGVAPQMLTICKPSTFPLHFAARAALPAIQGHVSLAAAKVRLSQPEAHIPALVHRPNAMWRTDWQLTRWRTGGIHSAHSRRAGRQPSARRRTVPWQDRGTPHWCPGSCAPGKAYQSSRGAEGKQNVGVSAGRHWLSLGISDQDGTTVTRITMHMTTARQPQEQAARTSGSIPAQDCRDRSDNLQGRQQGVAAIQLAPASSAAPAGGIWQVWCADHQPSACAACTPSPGPYLPHMPRRILLFRGSIPRWAAHHRST